MKKALIVALSIIMSTLFMLGIVGCRDKGQGDAEKVSDALETIRILYEDEEEETAGNYKVIGRVRVGDDFYDIDWSLSSQTANYQEYVSIGEIDANDDDRRLVTITPGEEKVNYTLKATVTIGKASDSIEFNHYIPAMANVLSVAQAIAEAGKLEDKAYSEPVLVKGYVVDAGTWNPSYNNLNNVYIADTYSADMDKDSEGAFLIYRIVKDDVYNTHEGAIEKGDLVTFRGALQKWGEKLELTYNDKVTPNINVTVVSLTKPTLTDAERVAKAKEAIKLSNLYNALTEVSLPATQSGATLSWAVKGTTDLVKIEDGKLKIVKLPTAETQVTLTVTITSGSVSDTKDFTITVAPAAEEGKIYSAAEAQALGEKLAANAYYEENGVAVEILVKGYVVDPGSWSGQYSNWTKVYIADTYSDDMDKDSEGTFLVYRIGLDDTYLKAEGALEKGDLITVKGYLQNYEGDTVELTYPKGKPSANPVCVGLVKPSMTDEQKVERALKGITLPSSVTKDVELPESAVEGVSLTFASDNAAIKIENGKMVVTRGDADVTVKITATASINGVTDTKEFNVVVKANVDVGDGTTASVVIADYAKAHSWDTTGNTGYDTVEVDENVTVTINATPVGTYGLNSGKCYVTSGATNWRIYNSETPSIVFTAKQGYKILAIKVTYSVDEKKPAALTNEDKSVQYASDEVISVGERTVTFSVVKTGADNGHIRITAIEVVYRALSADEHEHVWSYTHVENTWTHTATCTVEGCSETNTSACEPELNVCKECDYTYTEAEIVTALFALEAGESLPGTYELTGKITVIKEISAQYKNAEFTIKVGEKEIIVYRAKGEGYDKIKVGDTVTINGTLKRFYEKYEFDQGCTITKIVPGAELTDEQKVAEAKAAVDLSTKLFNSLTEVALPATQSDATLSWAVKGTTDLVSIADGKLKIEKLPTENTEVTLTVTITSGSVSDTKDITITIAPKATEEKVYTVAEVLEFAKTLAAGAYYEENGVPVAITVKGYVVDAGNWNTQYNNLNKVYIADEPNGEIKFLVYRIVKDDVFNTQAGAIGVGDLVTFNGALQNYQDKDGAITLELTYCNKVTPAINVTVTALVKSTTPHEHTFEEAWTTTETHHYHKATCEHKDEKKDEAEHVYDNDTDTTCNVCGYERTIGGDPTPGKTTVTTQISTYATTNGWIDGNEKGAPYYDTVELDENVKVTVDATPSNPQYGRNSGKYYSGKQWRIYQNENPSIVFTAKQGYKIVSIKVTYEVSKTGILTNADKLVQYASGKEITVNAETVTLSVGNTNESVTNGQVRITAIEVVYSSTGDDPIPPTPHEHTFEEAWTTTETHHYHKATCEHTNEKKDEGTHEYTDDTDTTCNVCGYERTIATHQHVWSSYTHVENSFTHTRSCTAEGCTEVETVDCAPELNVCKVCNYTYRESEILTALFALEARASLPGTYALTGKIVSIKEISTQYKNATFTIKVADKEIVAFRAKGTGYETLKVNDTVTINGSLKNYEENDGTQTFEFVSCTITAIVPAPHVHEYRFIKKDADTHTMICTGCSEVSTIEAHAYINEGDTVCYKCGYDSTVVEPPVHEHTFEEAWTTTETTHYHKATCEHTTEKKDEAEHVYDNDTDTTCNVCGYERTIGGDPTEAVWTLIEDVSALKEDAQVVFVYNTYVNGDFGTYTYLAAIDGVEYSDDTKKTISTMPAGAYVWTLAKSGENWRFVNGDNTLAQSTTSNNKLNGSAEANTWNITFNKDGSALIKNVNNYTEANQWSLQFNSGSPRFSNYKHTQKDFFLYTLAEGSTGDQPTPPVHEHTYGNYTSNGADGHTGTCTVEGCGETVTEAHTYDSDTATICNKCGYERTIGGDPTPTEKIYTVAEVIALAEALENKAYYMENGVIVPVLVKGYVVNAGNWNSSRNSLDNVKIADELNGTTQFLVYRIVQDNEFNTQAGAIEEGDLVTFSGALQNYNGTLELTYCSTVTPNINVTVTALTKQPTLTDAEKVAKAKAAVDLSKNYNAITEIVLPATQSGATLSWAVKGTTDLVSIENGMLKIVKLPAADTEVTLTVTITCGDVTDTKDITITIAPEVTEVKVYTVAEAKALAETLASDAYYEENGAAKAILVKGYVVNPGTFSTQYGNWSNIYIADEIDGTDTFLVFRVVPDDTYLKAGGDLVKDALVTFSGYLQNYKGNTPELTYNGSNSVVCVAMEKPTLTDEQKVENALNGITLPATVTEDVELPASAVEGVELTYTSDNAAIKIENGKMVVTRGDADVTVKITATATINSVSNTKEFTVVVKANGYQPTPTEELLYTLDTTTVKGGNSGYAGNGDVTVNGITWNGEGNLTMKPWRFGGNNITDTDRKLTSKATIPGKVSKIVVTFGAATITVNSVTLEVYTEDPANGAPAVSTKAVTHTKDGAFTIEAGEGEDWSNCYYRLVFNVTNGTGSNKYVTVTKIEFYGNQAN